MRFLAATLLLCGLGLLVSGSVGAAPRAAAAILGPIHCERLLLRIYGGPHLPGFTTGDGHRFHLAQAICVGSGGATRLSMDDRSSLPPLRRVHGVHALSSQRRRCSLVDARYSRAPRSLPVARHAVIQFAGWPPDFYMSRVTLLASDATPARFRSIVAPIAARIRQQRTRAAAPALAEHQSEATVVDLRDRHDMRVHVQAHRGLGVSGTLREFPRRHPRLMPEGEAAVP